MPQPTHDWHVFLFWFVLAIVVGLGLAIGGWLWAQFILWRSTRK